MKKKFLFGLIALLSVSFIFFGCGDSGGGGGGLGETTYTVTYDANEGTGTAPTDSNPYNLGDMVTVAASGGLTKSGDVFSGWNTQADGTGTTYQPGVQFAIDGNITLFAKWVGSSEQFSVTYDANEGSGTLTDSGNPYTVGNQVTTLSNTFTRTEYVFTGWNTLADGTGDGYGEGAAFNIYENTTLYAQWVSENTEFTVTYDANGGIGTLEDDDSPYHAGDSVTVLANTFTKADHVFVKWTTVANGSGYDYVAANTFTIVADTTLYAQWARPVVAGAIAGVTPPAAGGTPVPSVSGTGYTGVIEWADDSSASADAYFAGETIYVATITLTLEPGYTFITTEFDDFDVAGVDASKTGGDFTNGLAKPTQVETNGKVIIKAWFPRTDPAVITAADLDLNMITPYNDDPNGSAVSASNNLVINPTNIFMNGTVALDTGTVLEGVNGSAFDAGDTQAITITLTAASGYTFVGTAITAAQVVAAVLGDNFTGNVSGAAISGGTAADPLVVTATYTEPAPKVILASALTAITVYNDDPTGTAVSASNNLSINPTTIIATGTVALDTYEDEDTSSTFTGGDTQAITITLTAAFGYTFVGTAITANQVVEAVLGDNFTGYLTSVEITGGDATDPLEVTAIYTEPYVVIASGNLTADISAKYNTAPDGSEVTDGTLTVQGSLESGLVTLAEGSVDQGSNDTAFDAGDTQVVTITLTAAAGYTFTDTTITADDVVDAALGINVTGGLVSSDEEITGNDGTTLVVTVTYTAQ
jgi:uncharacterized repeat protein (TIGR02543 family)